MNYLIIILLVIGGILALLLMFAFFAKKTYIVSQEIVINSTIEKVYDYIKLLKNQDHFNKWVMVDPDMKKEFTGIDGTVGFIYSWNGNQKAGEGEQEIQNMIENKTIETEIRFVRPMVAVAYSDYTVDQISGNQTKLTWSNRGTMKFPMNAMASMVEKMLGKDMNQSLHNLKSILEK